MGYKHVTNLRHAESDVSCISLTRRVLGPYNYAFLTLFHALQFARMSVG